jgi:hypothetical protein
MNQQGQPEPNSNAKEKTRSRLAYIVTIGYIVLLALAILIPLALFAFSSRNFNPETLIPALVLALGGLTTIATRVARHYFGGPGNDE